MAGTTPPSSRNVELLLADDVPNLGKRGAIVRVKPGYARNYLLPYGYATVATEENKVAVVEHQKKLEALEVKRSQDARKLADTVSKYSVTLEANANTDGHLYGSVVGADISKALKMAGYPVTTEMVQLDGHLKECGMYTIKLKLHPEVLTDVKVWIVPSANK
jgi:ribosomal protein L9